MNIIKHKEGEKIIAIILPETGKITVEDLANAIGLSKDLISKSIEKNDIKVHKISDRLSSRWVVDLKDFWKKT